MVSAGIAEAASKRSVRLKLRARDKADSEVAEEVLLYEEAQRKAIAEKQAKIIAERERLAEEQQALAAQQKQQFAALTSNTQGQDLESPLRLKPSFDGQPISAGTK